MIDLVALDSLRAVDGYGSVVAAADALGFTPSAVSQQVKRLEKQTGVPLLERVGRGVMLTGHGRHLAEEGARLLADLEELQSGLHQQAGTATTVNLIAANSSGGTVPIPQSMTTKLKPHRAATRAASAVSRRFTSPSFTRRTMKHQRIFV